MPRQKNGQRRDSIPADSRVFRRRRPKNRSYRLVTVQVQGTEIQAVPKIRIQHSQIPDIKKAI